MNSKLKRKIKKRMQEHYFTFRVLVFLKEYRITEMLKRILYNVKEKLNINQRVEANDSICFFRENSENVKKVKGILYDEKSLEVFDACIKYRMYRKPVPDCLYTEYNQYFVDDIFSIENGEVFIDAGAYIGDTIQQFIDIANKRKINDYRIIAFEPSRRYYELVCRYFGKKKSVTLFNKGLSDREDVIYFRESGTSSRIVYNKNESTEIIKTTTLDNIRECRCATYIKMDIEGAELQALRGAKETIIRNHPKLAICIYHSNEDMIRIIQYLYSLVPQYRFYIRQHSRSGVETVLYATI